MRPRYARLAGSLGGAWLAWVFEFMV